MGDTPRHGERRMVTDGAMMAASIVHIRRFLERVVEQVRNRRHDECNYAIEQIKMIVRTKTHRNQNV
jgi:hypothetical protein